MKNITPIRKIALALLAIMLLPALIFTAYEINSLSDNEALIEEIYNQQLEAILFSVNQYCWDVSNGWVNNTERLFPEALKDGMQHTYQKFFEKNRAISYVFLADSVLANFKSIKSPIRLPQQKLDYQDVYQAIGTNPNTLKRLIKYQNVGYRKIESVLIAAENSDSAQAVILLFALNDNPANNSYKFAGIVIEPNRFLTDVLSPKLEELAGQRFYIAVLRHEEPIVIHPTTLAQSDTVNLPDITRKKAFWLFPQFYLGISPQGQTIVEVTRSQFYNNLVLILVVDLILICGVWFIYRNIRREMELAQLKSDFVSNISHELRTPLSVIRMYVETLEMGRIASREKQQEYYKVIGQESERLTHLVNNILNFSRIEAGKKEFHLQETDLNAIVERVLESYQFHLQNEGFRVETALADKLPAIQGDQEAISEALINLLDNGMKYSETEKFLRIATGKENGSVFLEVADKGIGIAPEHREKIFEKFHRVSGALVHNTKGSGLGLTLVKHIIEAHGGGIQVDSHPGKGSRFRLVFK